MNKEILYVRPDGSYDPSILQGTTLHEMVRVITQGVRYDLREGATLNGATLNHATFTPEVVLPVVSEVIQGARYGIREAIPVENARIIPNGVFLAEPARGIVPLYGLIHSHTLRCLASSRFYDHDFALRVYLAGSIETKHHLRMLSSYLTNLAVLSVNSQWLREGYEEPEIGQPEEGGECMTFEEICRQRCATDLRNIRESTHVIVCHPSGEGTATELGYALGAGKRVGIFLPKGENVYPIWGAYAEGVQWLHDPEEVGRFLLSGTVSN